MPYHGAGEEIRCGDETIGQKVGNQKNEYLGGRFHGDRFERRTGKQSSGEQLG